jgi:hypothetical protein
VRRFATAGTGYDQTYSSIAQDRSFGSIAIVVDDMQQSGPHDYWDFCRVLSWAKARQIIQTAPVDPADENHDELGWLADTLTIKGSTVFRQRGVNGHSSFTPYEDRPCAGETYSGCDRRGTPANIVSREEAGMPKPLTPGRKASPFLREFFPLENDQIPPSQSALRVAR